MLKIFFLFYFVIIAVFDVYADTSTGLIGWWRLDEGGGVAVLDSSGKGTSGDLTGHAPTWISGVKRGALSFSGVNQYIDLGNPAILTSPTGALSVSAWVYRTGALVNFSGIVSCQKNGSNEGGYILVGTVANNIRFYIDKTLGNWSFAETDSSLPLNQWTHLLGVWNGATILLYVNGVQQATTGLAASIGYGAAVQNAYIGQYATEDFPGSIDDVRIYSRALTALDVYSLYLSDNRIHNATLRNVQFK